MKYFFCILAFSMISGWSVVHAAKPLPKNGKIQVAGVGQVRIQHEVVGEPVSQPERVEIFVKCAGAQSQFRLAVFRMCTFDGYTYEEGTKVLSLSMHYGHVDPKTGNTDCEPFELKSIDLTGVCQAGK